MSAVVFVVADVGFHDVVLRSWAVVRNSCYGSFSLYIVCVRLGLAFLYHLPAGKDGNAGQVRAAQIRAAQVRAEQVRIAQVHAAQIRAAQVRAAQDRLAQVRAEQVRAGQVRLAQPCAAQIRAAQIRAAQVRAAQIRAAQVRAGQVRAGQCVGVYRVQDFVGELVFNFDHDVVLRSWAVVRNSCYGSFGSSCPVGAAGRCFV